MLAQPFDGQLVEVFQPFLDIVGVERGERSHHAYVLAPEREDIGICAQGDEEIAGEGTDGAEGVGRAGVDVEAAVGVLHHARHGEERLETLAHTHGAGAGTAAAMRGGEGLVEIDVHDIEAHVSRTRDAEHRVEVCAVVVHQSAAVVDELRNLRYLALEEPEGVGVGHHHRRDVVAEQRLEVSDIDEAVGGALHLDNLQSADSGGGGVGAVSGIGHDDLDALCVAAALVVGADDHQSRQLAVSPGEGVEGELSHARQGAERLLQAAIDAERTLHGGGRLQRMERGEGGQGCYLLVDDGVVFHRAAAKRVEAVVDAEVVGTVVGVVSDDGELVTLGQLGIGRTPQGAGDGIDCIFREL